MPPSATPPNTPLPPLAPYFWTVPPDVPSSLRSVSSRSPRPSWSCCPELTGRGPGGGAQSMHVRVKRKDTTFFLNVTPSDYVLEVKQRLQDLTEKDPSVRSCSLCLTSRT